MNSKKLKKVIGCGIFSMALSGCGSHDDGSPDGVGFGRDNPPTHSFGMLTSDQASKTLPMYLGSMLGLNGSSSGSSRHRLLRAFIKKNIAPLASGAVAGGPSVSIPDCAQIVEGSRTDADGDGIPAHIKAAMNCSQGDGSNDGYTTSYTGTVTETDLDDNNPYSGFNIDIGNMGEVFSGNGNSLTITTDGTMGQTVTATTMSATSNVTAIMQAQGQTEAFGAFMSTQIAPANMTSPQASGAVNYFKGFLALKAQPQIDVILSIASQNLSYSSQCQQSTGSMFQNGSLVFTDGNNNNVTYTFTNCQVAATYNGAPIAISSGSSSSGGSLN